VRYARAPIPPDDDDDEAWTERIAAAAGADMRSVEKLHDKLISNRRRLVRSLAVKLDPAVLASLATVGLAISQLEAVLREAGRPV
jgi:hypothetical protein